MSNLAAPKKKSKYLLVPKGKPLFEDEQRFGTKMLQKMGWTKGKGLGVNEDGSADFVRLRMKQDRSGLSFDKLRDDHWTQHEEGFNEFLQQLSQTGAETAEQTQTTQRDDEMCTSTMGFGFNSQKVSNEAHKIKLKENISGQSLEERSKTSRARVHYQKFTRGKDLTRYSEKDLASIFGKKVEDYKDEEQQPLTDTKSGVQHVHAGISTKDYFERKLANVKTVINPFSAKYTAVAGQKELNVVSMETATKIDDKEEERGMKNKKRKANMQSAEEVELVEDMQRPQEKQMLDSKVELLTYAVKSRKKKIKDKIIENSAEITESEKEHKQVQGCLDSPTTLFDGQSSSQEGHKELTEIANATEKKKKKKKEIKEKISLEQTIDAAEEEQRNEVSIECSKNKFEETPSLPPEVNKQTKKKKNQLAAKEEEIQNTLSFKNESIRIKNKEYQKHDYDLNQQPDFKNIETKSKKKSKKCKSAGKANEKSKMPFLKDADRVEKETETKFQKIKEVKTSEAANKEINSVLHENLFEKFKNAITAAATTTELERIRKKIIENVPKNFLDKTYEDEAGVTEKNPADIAAKLYPEESGKNINNVYTISTFCAEQFQNANLDAYVKSNLAEIIGYDLDENLELNIVEKKNDMQRLMHLWECRVDKYMNGTSTNKYWQYINEGKQARQSKTKIKRLKVKSFKRRSAFRAI